MSSDPWSDIKYGLERAVTKHSQEHFKQFEECKKDYAEIQKMFTKVLLQLEIYKKSFIEMERILKKHFPDDFIEESEDFN